MQPGIRLGPYEILQQLGAGGMGEVWLAQDTRLGRKVAVKVLPQQFASDPQRLARFEQEARAAAALNHPHIAVVHDIGHDAGVHFMVQEYLDGATLRTVLERGRLPLLQGVGLALQIAEALRAAHAAGIVHRDLKPENVFVSPTGHAKVLDFGLAKLTETAASGAGSASLSPTVLGTTAGQIMGTAGYMAPEQIDGVAVDHRADLFSFGCVLYELTTGRRAFHGKNMIETLDRVANRQPDNLATIDGTLPAELARILGKTLEKNPAARYQSAGDLAVDLRALSGAVESGTAVSVAAALAAGASGRRPALGFVAAIAAAAMLVGGVGGAWLARPAPAPRTLVHFEFDKIGTGDFTRAGRRVVSISPDGRRIAFTDDGAIQIRAIDDPALVAVRGSSDASSPNFSPDGEWLAYWADGELRKIPVQGGSPIRLAESHHPLGMSWDDSGAVLAATAAAGSSEGGRIIRVDDAGGDPEVLVQLDANNDAQGPSLLPGGDWVLFSTRVSTADWNDASIVAQSLRTGERRLLVPGGVEPRYVATGHLTFARNGNLFAVPFDAVGVEALGGPVPVLEGVDMAPTGGAYYEISKAGDLAFIRGGLLAGERRLAFYDLAGGLEILDLKAAVMANPVLSPDGQRIAVAVGASGSTPSEIWVFEIERGTGQRLTSEDGRYGTPMWSPDGAWIYFSDDVAVYRARSDFSGEMETVIDGLNNVSVGPFSADGKTTAISHQPMSDRREISLLDVDTRELRPAISGIDGALSPDGRLLAYVVFEAGRFRPYVLDLQSGERQVASGESGENPAWSADGKQLFFLSGLEVNAVDVAREPAFRVGAPRTLFFQGSFRRNTVVPTADGTRLLALVPDTTLGADDPLEQRPRIHVILNWASELTRRVPPR